MQDTSSEVRSESARETDRPAPSRPRYPRKAIGGWIAGFLSVLLVLELGLHAASGHLSDPVDYVNVPAQVFAHDMDVLHAAHIRSDLTFVGNSMVQRDIDAKAFEGKLPGVTWAHDVGIGGFQMVTTQHWLLEQVVPRINPRRVVIGISSSDFNAGRLIGSQTFPKYEAARATKPGLDGDANRVLENLALSKYRTQLRDPYQLYRDAEGKAVHIKTSGSLDSRAKWKLGYPAATPAQLVRGQRTELAYIRSQELLDFRIGTVEMQAFADTLQALRSKGIAVAVVLMPVSSQYIASHPHGTADFDAWTSAIGDAAGAPARDRARSLALDARLRLP